MANRKGVVMLIVLATILVVILLANIAFVIIASQSRLTHHQVSRIQAHYASMAGLNYAYSMLALGQWNLPVSGAPDDVTTMGTATACPACNIIDNDLPSSVNRVTITRAHRDSGNCPGIPAGITGCIRASTDYTY